MSRWTIDEVRGGPGASGAGTPPEGLSALLSPSQTSRSIQSKRPPYPGNTAIGGTLDLLPLKIYYIRLINAIGKCVYTASAS